MTYFGDEQWKKNERKLFKKATSKFVDLMRNRFLRKLTEGYSGWDIESNLPAIKRQLEHHIKKGYAYQNLVDIANISMMIYFLQQKKKENQWTSKKRSCLNVRRQEKIAL